MIKGRWSKEDKPGRADGQGQMGKGRWERAARSVPEVDATLAREGSSLTAICTKSAKAS